MRKIEQNMLKAIELGVNWKQDNTSVYLLPTSETGNPHGSRSEVYLHSHHLGDFWHNSGTFEVNERTVRDWPTRTTMSRLRALGINASIKQGRPYIDDKPL